jgi:fructokinase
MFVICGEALWDLFAVDTAEALTFDARIGGSSFNVAMGLSRLGQKAALFTGISTDRLGDRLVAALKREGVETRLLIRTDRPTTLSLVDVGLDGVPAYAFYGEGAADRLVTTADLPAFGPDIWGVHAGSYSIAVEPVGSSLLRLFEREAGRRLLLFDPNVRLAVEPERGLWRERVERFVAFCDLAKVSDEDLGLIYPGATALEIAGRWLEAGARMVVITRGSGGAEAFRRGEHIAVPSLPVNVVDTVGAGDTFQAALIAGLAERGIWSGPALDGLDVEQIRSLLAFAGAAAALTCTKRGADPPRRAELPRWPAGGRP